MGIKQRIIKLEKKHQVDIDYKGILDFAEWMLELHGKKGADPRPFAQDIINKGFKSATELINSIFADQEKIKRKNRPPRIAAYEDMREEQERARREQDNEHQCND